MGGGHAAGENGGPVRHAHGIGDPGVLEDHAPCCQGIQMRGTHLAVAHEADVIGPMLIGDDEENVRTAHPDQTMTGGSLSTMWAYCSSESPITSL